MISGNGSGDSEALRAEIRQTRAELGETVQALAARADVKARLKESAAQTRHRLREQAAQTGYRLRGQAAHTAGLARAQAGRTAMSARSSAHDLGAAARRNPVPWAAVLIGAATAVALALVRGRRRG